MATQNWTDTMAGSVGLYALAFVFGISLVIFVHELGHYTLARFFGVRITSFNLGFGRELWSRQDRHGTRWVLRLWPIGGYVTIFGDCDPADPRVWDAAARSLRPLTSDEIDVAFFSRVLWQRFLIVAAGPLVNFLVAFLILVACYAGYGKIFSPPVVTAIAAGTVAEEMDVRLGDRIVSLDGQTVNRFDQIWDRSMNEVGTPLRIHFERDGRILEKILRSRPVAYEDDYGLARAHGRLGMTYFSRIKLEDIISVDGVDMRDANGIVDTERVRAVMLERLGQPLEIGMLTGSVQDRFTMSFPHDLNGHLSDSAHEEGDSVFTGMGTKPYIVPVEFLMAVRLAAKDCMTALSDSFRILGILVTGDYFGSTQARKVPALGGIQKMGAMAGEAAEKGSYKYILFLAVLSLQIGFINLLPIPALDGGHLAFYVIEALRGKPLSMKVQELALTMGLALLVGIMILANLSDILGLTR